jgi:hypothetical protein
MRDRLRLFAVLAGAALALLWGLLHFGLPHTTPEEAPTTYAVDALADYLPADAALVLNLDMQRLRAAAVLRGQLGQPLRALVHRGDWELPWLGMAGVDPWDGVDRIRLVLPAGQATQPLWLIHGQIDSGRFQVGPGRLILHDEGRGQLYEYRDPKAGSIWLAVAGNTLVGSVGRLQLMETLEHAARPRPVAVRDSTLREMLATVDHTQVLWLAASLECLGPTPRLENRAVAAIVSPVLRRARAIEGGVRTDNDLQAEFTFSTADEASAEQLEKVLHNIVGTAQGAPLFLGGDRDLSLLFDLLGTGKTTREGAAVTLRCQLASE